MKIKLTRDELQCLCWLTNPVYLETCIIASIGNGDFEYLGDHFSLIEIGEKAAKKFMFNHKKEYNISFSPAQAAAFWNYSDWNLALLDDYKVFVVNKIKAEIHREITNYQRRYFKPITHA